MKFYVGITDSSWFNFLAERRPDEVNFWRPNSDRNFSAIETGAPFLFKLHSPRNYIVGGGFLVRHSAVPSSLAWEAFGPKNGAVDYQSFRSLLGKHRKTQDPDPVIGCTVLGEPFFFPEEQWIPVPKTWASNIVTGKCYDMAHGEGLGLWLQVEERLQALEIRPSIVSDGPSYGAEYLTRARLGQGSFRLLVTEAYQRRCAITGERILPVLEAAHIKRYSVGGPHRISNGVLLRSDLHTLFDKGYVTITPDYHVEVSPRLKERFNNGREYYKLHGKTLEVLPADKPSRPSPEFLEWHNQYSCAV